MIHQYKLNGYNIVLDVQSGSIHVVDDIAYDIIAMYESHDADAIVDEMMKKYGHLEDVNEEELRLCLADIEELKKQQKLFSEELFRGIAMDFKNRS